MIFNVKQVTSLEKVRPHEKCTAKEVSSKTVMKGEYFAYQVVLRAECKTDIKVSMDSDISEYVTLYAVKNNILDFPVYDWGDDDYITKEPCLMPDILIPIEEENMILRAANESVTLWVKVRLPRDINAGEYDIKLRFEAWSESETAEDECAMTVSVTENVLPARKLIFTQWFHVDCIADVHGVPIYSEEHWTLIEKYMSLASELGINMILTPVITPPLDTKVGTTRPCTQLLGIEKVGEKYYFDFSLLRRWLDVCKRCGMKYIEVSHLFSQWGIKHSANVRVRENGVESYMFGWHTDAKSPEYKAFLQQMIPALTDVLGEEGYLENTYFHISDEPSGKHLDAYKYAHDLIVPLIGKCRTLDAISDVTFYENGLISTPATSIAHMESFLDHNVENQWAYYCCGEAHLVSNRFMAMASYRTRIIGLQMYKYGIKGFLQWGYNFYYSQLSVKKIDPYRTTSADKAFPSGDPFSVYPHGDGAVPSLRAEVFREAINDISVCMALEELVGREAVIRMIDEAAGMNVTFKEYPRNAEYIPALIEKMERMIAEVK